MNNLRNPRKKRKLTLLIASLFILFSSSIALGQISSKEAGFIDAVLDFNADNTGSNDATTELQQAIDASISNRKPLFIPAGRYLVSDTLRVEDNPSERDLQNVFIQGSSVTADRRTVIVLAEGSFPDPNSPKHILYGQGWLAPDSDPVVEDFPDTINRRLQSVDFEIEDNNAGAIALRWRGAEGCSLFDVNIDVTGGLCGLDALSGSGGSTAKLSILGGEYGILLSNGNTQPTPTITDARFQNQNVAALSAASVRGSITITGASFKLKKGTHAAELSRARGWNGDYTFAPGGNLVLTDACIEYEEENPSNLLVSFPDATRDNSIFFDNVFVHNAADIVNLDERISSNSTGWRHFRFLAYSSGEYQNHSVDIDQDEPIYIDGVEQLGQSYVEKNDGSPPPSNLTARHSWGVGFPSFESPGAINVKDYTKKVINHPGASHADWSPAFNAAIEDAKNTGSNVVFAPPGIYYSYDTIHLAHKTSLIGAGHHFTEIKGKDEAAKRFGNSQNPWSDPKPMIDTPDSPAAQCILADIGVRPESPFDNQSHTSTAMPTYSLLWRAGNQSVIRNIEYNRQFPTANYRSAWVLDRTLEKESELNLRSVPSPCEIGGFSFHSESKLTYHTAPEIDSRIYLESVDGVQRLMVRSMPEPHHNISENAIEVPNLTIAKSDAGSFDITSIEIANAAPSPHLGAEVTLSGVGGNSSGKSISLAGVSRASLELVQLDWEEVTSVELRSSTPFSVSSLTLDNEKLDFESVEGELIAENVDYHHWSSTYGSYHLPTFEMSHAYIRIEGGVKLYNQNKHGVTWLPPTEPYIYIDNEPEDIVSIYHAHAQHSQNFYKIKIVDSHNVSIFGVKTENGLEFARIENSDNIRLYGHGGLTNPPIGTAHYRFVDSTNYIVSSPTDENYREASCPWCGLGDAMLPKSIFGTYDDIQEVFGENTVTPNKTHSPIMYRRGNPSDPWASTCSDPSELTISQGSGSGFSVRETL